MEPNKATQVRKIVCLLRAVLLVVGLLVGLGWWSVRSTTRTFVWVEHTHRILYELEATLTNAIAIQSGARGFGLTGDVRYLEMYDSGLLEVQHAIGRLREMVADNPAQQNRLRRLASLVDEEVAVMGQRLAARRAGGLTAASAATSDGHGRAVVGEIRSIIQFMQAQERDLLAARSGAAVATAWRTLLMIGLSAAAVGGIILVAIRQAGALLLVPGPTQPA